MNEKKTEHLTITLTPSEKETIINQATKQRRKPSEFIYLLVIDELERITKQC